MILEKILLVTWLVASAVSVGTTEYALNNYPTMAREANPLMQHRGLRLTVNIAAPVSYLITRPRMTNKQKLTVVAPMAAYRTIDAVHNVKTLKELSRMARP